MLPYFKCIQCGKEYPLSKDLITCPEHNPYYGWLTVMYNYEKVEIKKNVEDIFEKYSDLLPIKSRYVSLGENTTPLIHIQKFGAKHGFNSLYVKDESRNPTNSFKDRENAIAINMAIEWDIESIFTVSSGNAAVSTSAFAQKAGIPCVCIVPNTVSVGKRFLINLYGGKLIEKNETYEQMYHWAIDSHYKGWNCTPGINAIKDEGIKIIGYEIWEKVNVPDIIIVPCGNGTLLFGLYKAFKELCYLGITKHIPQFIGVQIKGASPLALALKSSKKYSALPNNVDSIAEGILAQESYASPKVMHALKDTGGDIIEVTDDEIVEALTEIVALESLIPEPTSAVVYAAVKKLQNQKLKTIVLVQTGGGMKNLKEIMESIIKI